MKKSGELKEYNRKRNFDRTSEPKGKLEGKSEKSEKPGETEWLQNIESLENPESNQERLRFVVQHHIARRDHFDFRLEWDGVLLSWAVPKGPSFDPRDKRLAIQVEDHPLEYRNFEGTIPKGEYGGGVVMLWDEGYWEPGMDVEEGLSNGSLKFALKGRRLKGKWALVRIKPKTGKDENSWLLLKEKDEYAKNEDGISGFTTSIRTGRTMAEIENGEDIKINTAINPFNKTDIQLAKMAGRVPDGDDWLFELKYDGYRIVAYIDGNGVKLVSRNGNDYTEKFREIAISLAEWAGKRPMVLDGEMVVTDAEGKTDFQALQSYIRTQKGKSLRYIVFDLLALDGEDLRSHRLVDRKEKLEELLKDSPENIHYSKHVIGNGRACFLAACKLKMEGIVGKKANSIYSGTRNGDWIKVKCDTRQEFVIGGYTLSDRKTSGVSSLLLGVYEGNELVYVGRAGTGMSLNTMKELEAKFERIKSKEPFFRQAPKPRKNEKIVWLEPVLVAEIKFTQWTEDNLLRQASFKGLRTDKEPKEIVREKAMEAPAEVDNKDAVKSGKSISISGIKITNPDKVIFEEPEIRKIDIVRYYEMVSERMIPFVSKRILSIVRCPKGISGACFFKKHPGPGSNGVVTIPVMNNSGEYEDYFYIENALGLLSEAQMGTLEFHTWGSRIDNLEKPDVMVFDLDPDERMELMMVRQGVKDLKSILDQLSLASYLKTSGGKGYHVVVPFMPSVEWSVFYDFARKIAEIMEQKWPERYTSNIRKEKRKNKIFIDWIRNGRGATSIAPYSLRARKGAYVSMPIDWEELDTVAPDSFDINNSLIRIKKDDPWKDFFKTNQRLK